MTLSIAVRAILGALILAVLVGIYVVNVTAAWIALGALAVFIVGRSRGAYVGAKAPNQRVTASSA